VPFIKDVRSQGGGGFSDADVCTLAQNLNFLEFKVCPHGQGRGGKGSQFFSILYGRLSWTVLSVASTQMQYGINLDETMYLTGKEFQELISRLK